MSTRRLGRVAEAFLILLITLNVAAIVLETVGSVRSRWGGLLDDFEVFSVAVFTIEYVVRLWASGADPRYQGIRGRLRYATTPMALVDLLAVLPSYVSLSGIDFRFLRSVRLFRLFRLAKLFRYSESMRLIGKVVRAKRAELLVSISIVGILILFSSCLIYFAEREAQPERFSSIPAAMWWAAVTLTTVGYGDVYPVTVAGRVLGAVVAILGIGMLALPTSILGAGFVEELQRRRVPPRCPHCGAELPFS